jgi:hypothetical protein
MLIASACKGSSHVAIEPLVRAVDPPETGGAGGAMPTDSAVMDTGSMQPTLDAQIAPTPDSGFDAGLDPDVVFEWMQKLPGNGVCGSGHYAGSFTCTVESDMALRDGAQVAGPISFELVNGATESVFTISEGRLSDFIGFIFNAELEGTLDCVARELHAGTARYLETEPFLPGTFEATLDGDFDDESLVITGDFVMRNADGDVCMGVFEASAVP